MDAFEFTNYHNLHCRFTFIDGTILTGVAFMYSFDELPAKEYYFVRTNELLEFRDAQSIGDKEKCQELAQLIDLNRIVKAELLS